MHLPRTSKSPSPSTASSLHHHHHRHHFHHLLCHRQCRNHNQLSLSTPSSSSSLYVPPRYLRLFKPRPLFNVSLEDKRKLKMKKSDKYYSLDVLISDKLPSPVKINILDSNNSHVPHAQFHLKVEFSKKNWGFAF